MDYPFTPRSNRYLEPGQFWALPLADGRFACGRVMAVPAFERNSRTGFVAGLADWIGDELPTNDALAGRRVLEQGATRFHAISKTGGEVLGVRPLEADGLVAVDFYDSRVGAKHEVWGWRTILNLAEELLAGR